jgi:hypothetical protein
MSSVLIETEQSYEKERKKPMPSFNHAIVQANLIGQFISREISESPAN